MEEIAIPNLTSEQVDELCEIAEKAARRHISSKIPLRQISTFSITIDTEGRKPITINVEIELDLLTKTKGNGAKKLANEATHQAFASIEKYLKGIACKSTK